MATFAPLLGLLAEVPDPRREGGVQALLRAAVLHPRHRDRLQLLSRHRHLHRRASPQAERHVRSEVAPRARAHRRPLHPQGPRSGRRWRWSSAAMPLCCRRHVRTPGQGSIALDGKTLRGSFDNFHDRAAAQVLSAFATDTALVLAHVDIAEKSNEIPAAQALLAELGVAAGAIVTLDALHCQKNISRSPQQAGIALIVQVKDNQPTLHQTDRGHRRHHGPARLRRQPRHRPQPRRTPHRHRLRSRRQARRHRLAASRRRHHPGRAQRLHPQQQDRAAAPLHRDRLLRLEHAAHRRPRRRGHPRPLGDRDHLPLQPRRHLRRRSLAHPHQPRRVRPPAQLRLQHPQGQPHRHPQPGPLPRRPRRL